MPPDLCAGQRQLPLCTELCSLLQLPQEWLTPCISHRGAVPCLLLTQRKDTRGIVWLLGKWGSKHSVQRQPLPPRSGRHVPSGPLLVLPPGLAGAPLHPASAYALVPPSFLGPQSTPHPTVLSPLPAPSPTGLPAGGVWGVCMHVYTQSAPPPHNFFSLCLWLQV